VQLIAAAHLCLDQVAAQHSGQRGLELGEVGHGCHRNPIDKPGFFKKPGLLG
jgi:hypothetical protein